MKIKLGRVILFIVVVAAAATGGFLYFGRATNDGTYVTVAARRGPISAVVAATGTISPVITVTVGSQVSGQVASLSADFNSVVKKGQVIATLDPANLQAQVARDRANLASSLAGLERARVEADNAQRGFERAQRLSAQNLLAQSDYDTAQAAAASAAASVRTAEAAVAQSRASLRISEVNLSHATIYSPVDGTVISRTVDVGQTVAASLQAPILFTIAQDLREMQVHVNVPESDIGRLAVDQLGTFTVDAYPEQRFRGRISEIRNSPTTIQNVVTYEAVIDVENTELKLKPGMTANVSVIVARKEDALLVPNAALRFKPPEKVLAAAMAKAESSPPPPAAAEAGAARGGAETGSGTAPADGKPAETGAGESGPGAGESGSRAARGARGGRQADRGEDASRTREEGGGEGPGRRADAGGSEAGERRGGDRGGEEGAGARRAWRGAGGSGDGGRGAREGGGRPGPVLWVLREGADLDRVPIVAGITDGAWTEVVSGSVQEGDPVVTDRAGSTTTASAGAGAGGRPGGRGLGRLF